MAYFGEPKKNTPSENNGDMLGNELEAKPATGSVTGLAVDPVESYYSEMLNNNLKKYEKMSETMRDPFYKLSAAGAGLADSPYAKTGLNPGIVGASSAAIGSFMKGFKAAEEANAGITDGKTSTDFTKDYTALLDLRKKKADMIDPIIKSFKADANVQDEITRGQAIQNAETFLNDPSSFKNRETEGTLRKLLAQAVRPEIKRYTGQEPTGISDVSGVLGALTGKGAEHIDELFNNIKRGGGVLDEDSKQELQNVLDNLKYKSKEEFARFSQPYVKQMENTGLVKKEDIPIYLVGAKDYDFNYVRKPGEEKIQTVKGSKTGNEDDKKIIYEAWDAAGKKWDKVDKKMFDSLKKKNPKSVRTR